MLTPPGFTPLEAAAGFAIGTAAGGPGRPFRGADPRRALEQATIAALQCPPCAVSFSGGRDSSLLLAVAARVAAREGLDAPIAVTLRYPQAPASEEARWQERVVAHLGVADWERIELTDELDCVGPVAREQVLRERAPLFPANAHSVAPVAARARGGTVLMGIGGDELIGLPRWSNLNGLLARRRAPEGRDVLRIAAASLPAAVRGGIDSLRHGLPDELAWLRPAARRRLARALARVPDEPIRCDRAILHAAHARYLELGVATIARIARAHGAELAVPLLDPDFVAAWSSASGRHGWSSRTAAMGALAADLLPGDVLARGSKANFSDAFFTTLTRGFAADWTGAGVDAELVDPERLRAIWLRPRPDFRSALLLQAAWLNDELAGGMARAPLAART